MDKQAFSLRLRECMQHKLYNNKPITAYRLDKLNVINQSTMENYLNGATIPDPETLVRLADYFCVSIDWLLTGKQFDERLFFNEESHNMIVLFQEQNKLLEEQMAKLTNIENSIKAKSPKVKTEPSESRA